MKKITLLLSLIMLVCSPLTYAELVGGKVIEIDPNHLILTINQVSEQTNAQEHIKISVVNETSLYGLESFSSIKVGDEIWAEAEVDEATNQWIASSIQKISDQTQ